MNDSIETNVIALSRRIAVPGVTHAMRWSDAADCFVCERCGYWVAGPPRDTAMSSEPATCRRTLPLAPCACGGRNGGHRRGCKIVGGRVVESAPLVRQSHDPATAPPTTTGALPTKRRPPHPSEIAKPFMPFMRVTDDSVAIINCALCGDITEGVPLCWLCWGNTTREDEASAIIAAMPADWPDRDAWTKAWADRLATP